MLVITSFGIIGGCGSSDGGNAGMGIVVDPIVPAGGDTSIDTRSGFAFDNPAPNLTPELEADHVAGDIDFGDRFVSAPSPVNPGLGPLFNNVSCESCHTKNGRGQPIFQDDNLRSQPLIRVSLPQGTPEFPGGPVPVPGIGTQIQDHAIEGFVPEADIVLSFEEMPGQYPDGTPYSLRKPILTITLADGTPIGQDIQTSMRIPPPVIGLGLLEAISEETLFEFADPNDEDGDGVSGRVNMVWNIVESRTEVGRFGRKANNPNLRQQTSTAYFNDMGVSNPDLRDPDGFSDIDEDTLAKATFYVQSLAVPNRLPTTNPDAGRGEELFYAVGCIACHKPTIVTGQHPDGFTQFSNQTIQAFTDLLLHDMGEGLADNRPDFSANGREWRTPPLWGLGLVRTISGGPANYLHDGRARTIEEAILWHGGEAETAVDGFKNLSAEERAMVLFFLSTL
ncbi:MAG: di-heme oxidoredictase family protein [Thermodesulfobacteriota bacterium]